MWAVIFLVEILVLLCVGGARWLTPTNLLPRGMWGVLWFVIKIINLCNKYVSSLWLMWHHGHTHLHLSIFASLFGTVHSPFSPRGLVQIFAGASKPCDMIRSVAHKPHYIFLKTATIPTYHGMSIAIPRYIAMQIPSSLHITSSFIIILVCMMI